VLHGSRANGRGLTTTTCKERVCRTSPHGMAPTQNFALQSIHASNYTAQGRWDYYDLNGLSARKERYDEQRERGKRDRLLRPSQQGILGPCRGQGPPRLTQRVLRAPKTTSPGSTTSWELPRERIGRHRLGAFRRPNNRKGIVWPSTGRRQQFRRRGALARGTKYWVREHRPTGKIAKIRGRRTTVYVGILRGPSPDLKTDVPSQGFKARWGKEPRDLQERGPGAFSRNRGRVSFRREVRDLDRLERGNVKVPSIHLACPAGPRANLSGSMGGTPHLGLEGSLLVFFG